MIGEKGVPGEKLETGLIGGKSSKCIRGRWRQKSKIRLIGEKGARGAKLETGLIGG